jgi:long-chain acyl-CoA synthetase
MYPRPHLGRHAIEHPDRPAIIMATSGETSPTVNWNSAATGWPTCCARRACSGWTTSRCSWRTTLRYAECCVAGERSGLYYTCINSYLKADELAYILDNSEFARADHVPSRLAVARQALATVPACDRCAWSSCDGAAGGGDDRLPAGPLRQAPSRPSPTRRSPTKAGHVDAVFVGHHRPAQGHPAAAAREAAVQPLPLFGFLQPAVARRAKAWSTCRRRRCTTRRRWPTWGWCCATAARRW